MSFEPWQDVLEQIQEVWNRQGPRQAVDLVRCNRVSLGVKSSLGSNPSSSITFKEIRLAYLNCPIFIIFIIYIVLYYIIFKWPRKLIWHLGLVSAL